MNNKILIAGFGSIGRRHLANIKCLYPTAPVALLRLFSRNTDPIEGVIQVFTDMQEAKAWEPEIVFVTNPASEHGNVASFFASVGADLFLEKPLAANCRQALDLMQVVRDAKVMAMVGYVLRFCKPLMLMKGLLDRGAIGNILSFEARVGRHLSLWRPGTDYRRSVTAQANLGGGVLLELSHELDYARWLLGEVCHLQAMTGCLGGLEVDVEDIAQINMRFVSGALGHIHMDMVDRASNRGCRIVGTQGTLCWDVDIEGRHLLKIFNDSKRTWEILINAPLDVNDMYEAQTSYFFECRQQRQNPQIDLMQGYKTLCLVEAAKESALTGQRIDI